MGDPAHAAERQQQLAAGHVLQSVIWLEPFPLSEKDPIYMLSVPAPVFIDRLRPAGGCSLRPGGWPGLEGFVSLLDLFNYLKDAFFVNTHYLTCRKISGK